MEPLLLLALAAALSVGCYQVYRVFDSIRNPTTRGDKKYKPSIPLQKPARKVARPRQGSTSSPTASGSGYLYLVSHRQLEALKIGISNNAAKSDRVSDHVAYGWKVENIWTFTTFSSAERIEGAVIAWWRNELKLPIHVPQSAMPQGGYTETVSAARIGVSRATSFIETLIGQAGGKRAIEVPISKLIPGAAMSVRATLKFATKDSHRWTYYSRSRRGYLYRNQGQSDWQRWVLEDGTGELLVELRATNSVPIKELKVGSQILVVGRVEKVGSTFRMTDPIFEVLTTGTKSRTPKTRVTNEPLLQKRKPSTPTRGATRPNPTSLKKAQAKSQGSSMTTKAQLDIKLGGSQPSFQLAERCSSCGALVPNGASHDC